MPPHDSNAEPDETKRGVFVVDPSKRCELSAYLFTRAVKFFLANGYTLKQNVDESGIVLVNSCCVTEDKIATSRAALEAARNRGKGKQVVLFGCMADFPLPDMERDGLVCIGPGSLGELDRLFPHRISVDRITAHKFSPAFYEPGQGLGYQDYFVMIARGCSNNCAYCNIKRVKGAVRSEPPETILREIRQGLSMGVEEFVLLADDCASYGNDRNADLAGLIEELFVAGKGFRLKLNYLFPGYVTNHLDRLKGIFETKRISYVNIPLQSGSQRILNLMNRRYAVRKVWEAVRQLRALAPGTRLCTHMMINFPTETEDDFMASLNLADAFDTVLFLHYSDNRGTAAAGIYPKVTAETARKRLDRASDYVNGRGMKSGAVISDFNCGLPYNLSRNRGE